MYQVYTQPRPGRPGLAILSTGLLLLLTVCLAWALIIYKGRIESVPLTEPQVYENGGLRCRLPLGWQKQVDDLPQRIVAATIENEPTNGRVRKLYIFRNLPHSWGIASRHTFISLDQVIQSLVPGSKYQESGFAQVGPLPGCMVEGIGISISPKSGRQPLFSLGYAGIAPQGQIVGAALISTNEIKRPDREMLEQVCASLELLDVRPTEPAKVMAAAGIQFHEPTEAVFFSDDKSSMPCIQMLGGEQKNTWFLDVYCVPLVGSRKPADLVSDFALDMLAQADLPEPLETSPLDGRTYAELKFSPFAEAEPSIIIACAQTEEHTGLLLVGRHEQTAGKSLQQQVRDIARTATVKPFNQRINLSAAQDAARQMLKALNLSREFGQTSKQHHEYKIESAAVIWGSEVRDVNRLEENNVVWWSFTNRQKRLLGDELRFDAFEKWTIREEGSAHTYDYQISSPSLKAKYSEQREPHAAEVLRDRVVTPGSVLRGVKTQIDDTFCPEPILFQAAAKLAWEPQAKPMLFNATEVFTKNSVYYLLVPLGHALPAGGNVDSTLSAVQLLRDYDPSPITLYFNHERTLVCLTNDNGRWEILEGQTPPTDIVR